MRLSFASPRLTILVAVLGFGPTQQELWSQQEVPLAQMREPYRRLRALGELRLKTYSIHGLAPMVVLFTEAPASGSEVERRYRHQLTSSLLWAVERLGVSLFSLHPTPQAPGTSHVDQMKRDALAAFEIFRGMRPGQRPQVFIGFAEGASAAARLLLRDSLSAGLVALVPSTPGDSATTAQEVLWQELLAPTDHPRPVLVLESMCNTPITWLAQASFRRRQTVLMLPQYDGWLSRRTTSACPRTPAYPVAMDYELTSIVIDWLRRTVGFPS
jgi:hypothetical protein